MKDNITCEVINDMLPLYVSDVLSEDSRILVSAHLDKCESCRRTLADLSADTPAFAAIKDDGDKLFKTVRKKYRAKVALRSVEIALAVLILWGMANFWLMFHYKPVWPKADPAYIKECVTVEQIGEDYYLHQTDLFSQGDIVLLSSDEDVIKFYLGENGLRSLGLGRSWNMTPNYKLLQEAGMTEQINRIEYCKPDGTVLVTLWEAGDTIPVAGQ